MRRIVIDGTNDAQRLDKFLCRYLDKATKGFIYKMLRKKNIKLNDARAEGSEILKKGDVVDIYISEESILNFIETVSEEKPLSSEVKLNIIYEDEDILVIDKPAGMLSQKALKDDISANEYILDYLKNKGEANKSASVCNRLDRNTTGLMFAGKNLHSVQRLSKAFKDRSIHKYYVTFVKGRIDKEMLLSGDLKKDERTNRVAVTNLDGNIKTRVIPLVPGDEYSLVKIELITGKTHQIRAHLAFIGHPIIGDHKYGLKDTNDYFEKKYKLRFQLLHAYEVIFDDMHICAKPPELFLRIVNKEGFDYEWRHGVQED